MSAAGAELKKAIVARLRADAPLLALLGGARVWTNVPRSADTVKRSDGTLQPYVQLRENAKPWDTTTDYGKEHTLELNCWTEHQGTKEADAILAALETSLRDCTLVMSGHRLVNIRWEMGAVFRDGEGQTYCGYQRWRAVTEES